MRGMVVLVEVHAHSRHFPQQFLLLMVVVLLAIGRDQKISGTCPSLYLTPFENANTLSRQFQLVSPRKIGARLTGLETRLHAGEGLMF